MNPLRFGIILAERFTLSAFAVFVDHLRLAADEGDRSRPLRIEWFIMSSGTRPITSSCGAPVQPNAGLMPPDSLDYIVVVGGLLSAGRQVDDATLRYVRKAGASATALIGICTGSFILCRAGAMRGRKSCVSWYHHRDFLEAFPRQRFVADRLFLVDGPRITCAGGAGAAALATYLIEKHVSPSAAQKATQVLLFERQRSGNDAQPHPPMLGPLQEPRLRRCMLLMEQNLSGLLPLTAIAAELSISMRQFQRLCAKHLHMSPAQLYAELRMRHALWLVESTDRTMMEIAADTGFVSGGHFSKRFKDVYGQSPTAHRLQFCQTGSADATGARAFLLERSSRL